MVPATAMMIADRFASEYLNYVQQEYKEANMQGYELLEKQAEALRGDIARSESARLDYQKNNGIISRADNQGILTERLKQLDAGMTDTRIKRVGLETLARQVKGDRAKSEYPWDDTFLATAGNNQQLRQDLDTQLALRAVAAGRYGPNHPKLRDIDAQIKSIETSIKRNFDDATHDLDSQVEVAVRTEQLLKKEFDAAFESSIEIEKLATNYEILSAGVESKKISLEELEKKIGEASISSKLPADFMEVVDPAYLVKHRIPRQVLYGILVGLLSLGAFVTFPLVASTLDERVTGTADVEKTLGLSLIGAIPVMKLRVEDRAHVVRDRVDVVMAEAFLGIIGQLEIGSGQRYPKVVLVTSTLPGEGKSLMASNLASAYRQLGKKTVLVDMDLRRPVQHALHGVALEGGFLAWARSGFPMDNVLDAGGPLGIRSLADGVDLIAAGGADEQPGHFIISKSVEGLMGILRGVYDVVILDTPPGGVFQDALVLGRYTTDRLLVARESVPPTVQAKKTIDDFAKADLPFRGLILNGFIPGTANKRLAYTYKAATKGYGYGGHNGAKPKTPGSKGRNNGAAEKPKAPAPAGNPAGT
jgi:Mrp family chromosome partitioning ATPase